MCTSTDLESGGHGTAAGGPDARPLLVMLCTGNAARSVMAGVVLSGTVPPDPATGDLPVAVVTAGTHVVEGQPMSRRTRDALASVGFDAPLHRSHQLTDDDVASAQLIVAMAGEHVGYVRRRHPEAAGKTATLQRLVRDLPSGPEPLGLRLAALDLAGVELEPWEDVTDPAGGEDPEYVACAREIATLARELASRL